MQNQPDHRELLELAAKAADYRVFWHHANQCHMIVEGVSERKWKPLEDSGDALRLAVKLELDILNSCISVRAIHRDKDTGASIRCRGNAPQIDPYAATRRAIVRAAAEIGRTM